jgi:ABC-type Na+ efflux pump permease subunit
MNGALTIAVHDLRITLRDRSAVMWMFFLPIIFAAFFGLVIGGGSSSAPADGTVALTVLDHDDSSLSHALIEELKDDRLELVFRDPSEPKAAETFRTLVIPKGFGASVAAGNQTTLRLEKEPDTSAEAALVAQARIVRSATRLIATMILAEAGTGEENLLEEDGRPLVSIETSWAGARQGPPSGFQQSIPGNATMFVLLVSLVYGGASISSERHSGLLRRLVTSPLSRGEIVAGKILGRCIIAGLQVSVLIGAAAFAGLWVDLDLGGNLAAIWGVLLVYGACVAPLGVALGAWFTDRDRAANLGVMAAMAMAAFGGCWWPLEVVSKPLQNIAMIFPTTWAMKALHGLISFGHDWQTITPFIGVLLVFGLAFSALAVRSLRVE